MMNNYLTAVINLNGIYLISDLLETWIILGLIILIYSFVELEQNDILHIKTNNIQRNYFYIHKCIVS